MRYAGLRAFLAIAAGIVVQCVAGLPVWFWVVWALIAIAAVWFTRGYSLLLVLAAAAAIYNEAACPVGDQAPVPESQLRNRVFVGVVLNEPIPHRGGRTYNVQLRDVNIGEANYPLDLAVRVGTGRTLRYGDRVRFRGSLLPFNYPRNPGLADINEYFRKQGLSGRIRAGDIVIFARDRGNVLLQYVVMPLRRFIVDVIGQYSEAKNRALLAGLLLGETGDMPESTMRAFSIAGVTHILAVSGLNVAILIGMVMLLLSIFGVRGWPGLAIVVVITAVYVGVTGFAASAVRAGIMAIALTTGLYVQRRYDVLNGLFIAGIIILLAGPRALFDVGFQLSFAATAAIILFSNRIARLFGRLNEIGVVRTWLISPLSLTMAGTLGTAPLIMYYFHRVSLLSFAANLVIVPLSALALPLGMLVVTVAAVSHAAAGFLSQPLALVLSATVWLTERIPLIPWAALPVAKQNPVLIAGLYLLILALALMVMTETGDEDSATHAPTVIPQEIRASVHTWARRTLLTTGLAGLGILVWVNAFPRPILRVTFLDCPQSEATFVQFPSGRNLLIDAGNGQYDLVTTFLESRGVSQLDLLVVTHPDRHVCAGIEKLLAGTAVRKALVPTDSGCDPHYNDLLRHLRQTGCEIAVAGRADEITGLAADVRILSPTPLLRRAYQERALSANDLSIVMRIECEGCSVLLPGDLDNAALLDQLAVRSTILKASHQGSVRANSDGLLDMVQPDYLIVGGRRQINPKLEARLDRRGITTLNTRRDGAAVLTAGNKGTSLHKM